MVIECSGNYKVLENGIPYLKDGGTLVVYAVLHEPYVFNLLGCPNNFSYKHIDPDVPKALHFVCDLMENGKIPTDLFLTHKWHFDEVAKAYAEVRSGNVIKGLVVIEDEAN